MLSISEDFEINVFSKSNRALNIIKEVLEKKFVVKKLKITEIENLRNGEISIIDTEGIKQAELKKIIENNESTILIYQNNIDKLMPMCLKNSIKQKNFQLCKIMKIIEEILERQNHNLIFPEIVGSNKKIIEVKNRILKTINSDQPVLITGDSGTGKELIAETIAKNTKRYKENFLKINCASFNENNMEPLLYGTDSGFFTDVKRNFGYIEQAKNGVLFLDELSTLDYFLQSKLLRIIEEQNVKPLGSTFSIPFRVRFITATNENLLSLVDKKKFRKDLFYRIGALNISIPPLSERVDDIPKLANYFLKKLDSRFFFTDSALDKLMNMNWTGNVRQLQNVIKKSCFLRENTKKNKISADTILYYY